MKPQSKIVVVILFCAMPAMAQYGYGGPPSMPSMPSAMDQSRASAHAPSFPWAKDDALLTTVQGDVRSGGITAVAPHVADVEQALTNPQLTYNAGSTVYVLTDGPGETLAALAVLGPKKDVNTVAMASPYPLLSLYLGSYYNEVGKPDQALRVLDAGLKLSPITGVQLGKTMPALTAERGAALAGLKRWQDDIDNEDAGLKLEGASDKLRALLDRGRGYALTELGRLDEAEAAYNESLKLEPGNPRALHELQYIAGLRTGAQPTPGGIIPLQQPQGPAAK
jgi:tetratricopeptide (TPR) repeat protein